MLPSEDKNEHSSAREIFYSHTRDTNIHHRIPRDAPPKPATKPEDKDDDEPDPMMESVTSIFVLEEEKREEEGEGEGDVVDVEDRKKRLDRLKTLKPTLEQLWWSNSNYMAAATEKLADGSRDRKWDRESCHCSCCSSLASHIMARLYPSIRFSKHDQEHHWNQSRGTSPHSQPAALQFVSSYCLTVSSPLLCIFMVT